MCGTTMWLLSHLAKLLALVVWYERPQVLETRIYRLHSSSLVRVGDLPAHPFLMLHGNAHLRRPVAHHDGRESGWRRIHTFL